MLKIMNDRELSFIIGRNVARIRSLESCARSCFAVNEVFFECLSLTIPLIVLQITYLVVTVVLQITLVVREVYI
jgi:hypothetical protein